MIARFNKKQENVNKNNTIRFMYKNYIEEQTLGDVGIGFCMSKLKNTIAATQLKKNFKLQ